CLHYYVMLFEIGIVFNHLGLLTPFLTQFFPYTTLFRSYFIASDCHFHHHLEFTTSGVFRHFLLFRYALSIYERRNKYNSTYYVTDRKSTRLNSSHVSISYAVFCLKKKKSNQQGGLASRT